MNITILKLKPRVCCERKTISPRMTRADQLKSLRLHWRGGGLEGFPGRGRRGWDKIVRRNDSLNDLTGCHRKCVGRQPRPLK